MLDQPQVVQTTPQRAAVIRLTIPRSEIQSAMGPAIGEVMQAVAKQGIGPAGRIFSHHSRMTPETFDFEVGVPVTGAVQPTGRVKEGELPAAKVVRTIYRGSYEGLGDAWQEFCGMTTEHKTAENLWERYLTWADANPDPLTWQTELNRPIID